MTATTLPTHLQTSHGPVPLPAYVPVTTFGAKYPLDDLVRPYLPRLAPAAMVSLHYARQMTARPNLPLMVDSGGFASLFGHARVLADGGVGILETTVDAQVERLHPADVLDYQERHADIGFTLDFPVPPSMDPDEGRRRIELTIANARWAIENRRRRDLLLFASIQGTDPASYAEAASRLADLPFDGFAIGGLVPRASDRELVMAVVDAVRGAIPGRPLHVFGLGNPDMVGRLFQRGVQSVDSSSYVRLAADGKRWGAYGSPLADASPVERLHLALCNLAVATQRTVPLAAAASLTFSTPALAAAPRPPAPSASPRARARVRTPTGP
jgi:helicase